MGLATALVFLGVGNAHAAKQADLIAKPPSNVPSKLAIDDRFTLKSGVQNKGSGSAKKSTTGFYLSFDQIKGDEDVRLTGKQGVGALGGGRSATGKATLKAPSNAPMDQLFLLACADDNDRLRESDEGNNCAPTKATAAILPPITSLDLIREAQASGAIGLNAATLYKLRAIIGYPQLPKRFRATSPSESAGGVSRSAVADILAVWDDLSTETKLEIDSYLRPPAYQGAAMTHPDEAMDRVRRAGPTSNLACSGGIAATTPPALVSESWESIETEHFRFWYYTVDDLGADAPDHPLYRFNSDPAGSLLAAQNMAAVAEHVYDQETTVFGREPLTDGGLPCNGGDGKIDVYAVKADTLGTGAQVRGYGAVWVNQPGWAFVRPDFAADPTQARDVFAHEFAHFIQMAFDYADVPNRGASYGWLEEASANWAIDYVYPEDDFEHPFGRDYVWNFGFNVPINFRRGYPSGTPSGHLNGENGYEDYLFFFYLTHRFNPTLMAQVWANTESENSIDAVDEAIPGGWASRWPEFARYNLNRDELAHYRAWDGFEPGFKLDGSTQPHLRVALNGKGRREFPWPLSGERGSVDPLSIKYASFEFDENVKKVTFENFGFDPPDEFNETQPDEHDRIYAWWQLADGSTQVEEWTNESEVSFCRESPEEDVQKLAVLYTNSRSADSNAGEPMIGPDFPIETDGADGKDLGRVVAQKQCGFPEQWSGRSNGTVTYDGLTESWSATYTMNRTYQDQFVAGYNTDLPAVSNGTMEWHISGTEAGSGCTVNGGGTVPAIGIMDIVLGPPDSYGHEVHAGDLVDVVRDCPGPPDPPPQTISYRPLNCAGACSETNVTPPPTYDPGQALLEGTATYDTMYFGDEAGVNWSWQLTPGPTPPPDPPR